MKTKFYGRRGFSIGENSIINQGCTIDTRGGVRVGANSSVSEGVTILTAEHDPTDPGFKTIFGPVVIEDYCFVGTNATLLPNSGLGNGSVLGAGSVLTKNVPSCEIWAGNPARKIGTRSAEFSYKTSYNRFFH